MVKNGKSNNNRLQVCRMIDVPLHEVSGICLRRGRNGRMSLIAVGDRMSKVAWFSLPRIDDGRIDWHTSDIAELSGSMLPHDDPQIEAVCADGLGRVLLLQETPPRVELIDPKTLKVVASIDLAVEGRGEIARAWSDPEGSRGEGMVLLPGGHLLVAKEKKPAALIEFGPPNSQSRGLVRGGALPDGERWPIKNGFTGSLLSRAGFPIRHWPKPASTLVTSRSVRMVASICSVTSPPRLRGSVISRRAAARLRSLMRGGSAIWTASRSVSHSPRRVMRSSG